MKRYLFVLGMMVALLSVTLTCTAEYNFDISVFENNPLYSVEFDEMDDTGTITLVDGDSFFGITDDEGTLLGDIDIRITENAPPIIRITVLYYGEDWVFTDDVILKPASTRYTFEVERQTDVDDGKIYEQYTLVLTDDSIGVLKDIVDENVISIKYRLDGDRDVNGDIFFLNLDNVKQLYKDYIKSGALNNDFSRLKIAFPCEIK